MNILSISGCHASAAYQCPGEESFPDRDRSALPFLTCVGKHPWPIADDFSTDVLRNAASGTSGGKDTMEVPQKSRYWDRANLRSSLLRSSLTASLIELIHFRTKPPFRGSRGARRCKAAAPRHEFGDSKTADFRICFRPKSHTREPSLRDAIRAGCVHCFGEELGRIASSTAKSARCSVRPHLLDERRIAFCDIMRPERGRSLFPATVGTRQPPCVLRPGVRRHFPSKRPAGGDLPLPSVF